SWRSRCTRSPGTVIVSRRAQLRGSATATLSSDVLDAIPLEIGSKSDAKGGTRTPTGRAHQILSLARLPVPPLSRFLDEKSNGAPASDQPIAQREAGSSRVGAGVRGIGRDSWPRARPGRAASGAARRCRSGSGNPDVCEAGAPIGPEQEERDDVAGTQPPEHGLRLTSRVDGAAVDLDDAMAADVHERRRTRGEHARDDRAAGAGIAELTGERGGQLGDLEAELLGRIDAVAVLGAGPLARDLRLHEPDAETIGLPIADHPDVHGFARLVLGNEPLELADPLHLLSVHLDDDVAALDPRQTGGRVLAGEVLDEDPSDLRKPEDLGVLGRDVDDVDPKERAAHVAVGDEVRHDPPGEVRRDRESVPLIESGPARDGRVDPDDLAPQVHERPTRVPRVDDRVRL